MPRPLIGIISNHHMINDTYEVQAAGIINISAVGQVSQGLPVLVPAEPDHVRVSDLLEQFSGFVFTGGRANVHPAEYGEEPTEAHGEFDSNRDRITLPLIRALVDRGQPFLGICRGFQEVNVAMGGSLYPEIRDLPGRDNHRMPPDGSLEEKFALRHDVTFTKDGVFHKLMGQRSVQTNTLHGQGIKVAGSSVVVDGHAPDGTPEAIYIDDAPGFTLSVQWHPEWNAKADPVSRPLFEAFGAACRSWAKGDDCRSKLRSV